MSMVVLDNCPRNCSVSSSEVLVHPVGTRDREPFSKKQIQKKAFIISDWVFAFVRMLQYVTHSPIKPPRKCPQRVHFTFAMALGKRG